MTNKQQAEQLVRERVPELLELSFGCEVKYKNADSDTVLTVSGDTYEVEYAKGCIFVPIANRDPERGGVEIRTIEIIGHKPQLQHYLAVLGDTHIMGSIKVSGSGNFLLVEVYEYNRYGDAPIQTIKFSANTGAPASESDAEAFINLVTNKNE